MADGMEGIDVVTVTAWFADRIENLVTPLNFELLAGGHSNLTYLVTDGAGRAMSLRRPPLGHRACKAAHDMGREHKIISALKGSSVPVATTVDLCTDHSVNDAPFTLWIMWQDRCCTTTMPPSTLARMIARALVCM